jgi:hypothetical protein
MLAAGRVALILHSLLPKRVSRSEEHEAEHSDDSGRSKEIHHHPRTRASPVQFPNIRFERKSGLWQTFR